MRWRIRLWGRTCYWRYHWRYGAGHRHTMASYPAPPNDYQLIRFWRAQGEASRASERGEAMTEEVTL